MAGANQRGDALTNTSQSARRVDPTPYWAPSMDHGHPLRLAAHRVSHVPRQRAWCSWQRPGLLARRPREEESAMCGIFGYVGEREDAAEVVLDGLKKLEY